MASDGVSPGGLDVYDKDYRRICRNADMPYLTALPQGTYYVSIHVTKRGGYREAAGDYESFGYECMFRYVVEKVRS
ncbi:MAG: hypothetical protein GX936_03310 [Clostridiales bacterium]|nr:hypothetical protein [Clostridiales bacterium]